MVILSGFVEGPSCDRNGRQLNANLTVVIHRLITEMSLFNNKMEKNEVLQAACRLSVSQIVPNLRYVDDIPTLARLVIP
jgi:hypothetical protein